MVQNDEMTLSSYYFVKKKNNNQIRWVFFFVTIFNSVSIDVEKL